ncbi:MAG TPA: hypothetical protein VMS31_22295 [Pyrinomonadaceae bacterium]|nr:hypothetical protein [Pyrinomonadaceae bacterium]
MNRTRNLASDQRRRKLITILWTGLLAVITITLIYKEMTAVLYILATLGVTALLVVVAMADLEAADNSSIDSTTNDSAAIGSGITSTFGSKKS